MRRPVRATLPAFLVLICAGGCKQSVNIEVKRDVSYGSSLIHIIDGPQSQQRIRVQLTGSTPVHVCVMLEKDADDKAQEDIERGVAPKNSLAFTAKSTETTLEATIPPKESYRIWVAPGAKTSSVTLKVNSI